MIILLRYIHTFLKVIFFDEVKIIDNKAQNIDYETLMFLSFNVIYREYPLLYILIYMYARKL
jgi:hypothetical protein